MKLSRPVETVSRPSRNLSVATHLDYTPEPPEEESIIDDRVRLRPAEVVQMKLLGLLPTSAVPVSCLHTHRATRR